MVMVSLMKFSVEEKGRTAIGDAIPAAAAAAGIPISLWRCCSTGQGSQTAAQSLDGFVVVEHLDRFLPVGRGRILRRHVTVAT
jgi:hypothetical protein